MHGARLDVRRIFLAFLAVGLAAALAVSTPQDALADHPAPGFAPSGPLSSGFNSDAAGEGENIGWELITTIPTGNPHTDIDFFTQGGESYASVGTLGVGPNAGGQSIIQLTTTDEETGEQTVDPSYLTAHPSATCISNPEAALGLQHDVEASPKGDIFSNASYESPVQADAQVIIDATDAEGRCHDQGTGGLGPVDAPRGGLEIIDITDLENPVEIGLTSHIGEAHTVNIDPKRPHIAYAVSSDSVSVSVNDNGTPDDESDDFLRRNNEDPASSQRFNLDGFEVVDFSSCLAPPYGTMEIDPALEGDAVAEAKRASCRPEVFRYRYPTLDMSLGHTRAVDNGSSGAYGCHELEIYPDDRLTCGSGGAALVFDMAGAFDDMGTPDDYTDDKPMGTPLPCRPRESSTTSPGFATGATVMDCVVGGTDEAEVDLTVPNWIEIGSPSLEGVKWLGSVYHQGRGAGAYNVKEDIDFNHETEFTQSGKYLLATDERGGGVVPPGAACDQADINLQGNGGVHAYQVDELKTVRPQGATAEERAEEAFEAYARGTDGEKAIFRAPVRTQPQATVCTAHVMQQIPGQNRIFMGWYSQGTQVIDYVELPNGQFEWVEDQDAQEGSEATDEAPASRPQAETQQAGYFIPENANTWVSHIFKVDENDDGTFTYYGATGDFNIGAAGRNAIDVYKVTLPAPADVCTLAQEQDAYTDIESAREVHRRSVNCVLHYEIARGTSDTTYTPGQDVTREQMASFVVNALEAAGAGDKLPAGGGADEFSDIAKSKHRDNINRLADAGIIRGTGGRSFSPGKLISREQMATFMVAAARFATGDEYAGTADHFADVTAANPHRENINGGFEAGLFSGTKAPEEGKPASGTFSPDVEVKRDQMATFLIRLVEQTIQ